MKRTKRLLSLLSAAAMSLSMFTVTAAAEDDTKRSVAEIVAGMTTQQKIEQMIMPTVRQWYDGVNDPYSDHLSDEQEKFLREHNFCGVCLYAGNITGIKQTVELTDQIQSAALSSECAIPMLISADQEGGKIYRLMTGTPTCGNMALGAAGDPELAKTNASILGSELSALGINTDFAPVVDVNNNPSNPVINIRSFSSDPQLVSDLALGYIEGLREHGIITTCKHFPGHGDTGTDSHTGLPLINKTYDELKALELVPYYKVCDTTDMIMTAHIQFPMIETDSYTSKESGESIKLPATLSKTMITDILRGDLGFDGVVTTDSMIMGAIDKHFDRVDAAELAINADVDIILEPFTLQSQSDIEYAQNYINALVERVESGRIPMSTIDKSVTRILTMKQERGILDYTAPDAEKAARIVGCNENREKALEVAQRAVTLVKNDDDLLPLKLDENGSVAYFFPYDNVENTMTFALDRLKKDGVINDDVTAESVCYQDHEASEYEEIIDKCQAVIVSVEMYNAGNIDKNDTRGWQAAFTDDLIELAHSKGKKVVFLSANIPYDIARFTAADAIVAAYNADGMDELPEDGKENTAYGVNYPAALITILGGNAPTGKLPVDIYDYTEGEGYAETICYAFGHGLEYKTEETPEIPDDTETTQPEEPEDENVPGTTEPSDDVTVPENDDDSDGGEQEETDTENEGTVDEGDDEDSEGQEETDIENEGTDDEDDDEDSEEQEDTDAENEGTDDEDDDTASADEKTEDKESGSAGKSDDNSSNPKTGAAAGFTVIMAFAGAAVTALKKRNN